MDPNELRRVEKLCSDLYGNPNTSMRDRMEAHRALMILQTSSQYLPQCKYILEHSSSDYALLFASHSVLVIVSKDWRNTSPAMRTELRTFLLQKLMGSQDPDHFITRSLINVLCRITRLAWIYDPQFRTILDEARRFLQAGNMHTVIGLRIIANLVYEFDVAQTGSASMGAVGGRVSAQSFRGQGFLTQCFKIAMESVSATSQNSPNNRQMLKESLRTLLACLEFDFVGTSHDDGEDGTACLYLPTEWAEHIAVAPALKRFFDIYEAQWNVQDESEIDDDPDGPASLCLQLLSLLTAVRRSVFDQESRKQFLAELLTGTSQLMVSRKGLAHNESCLHHLCRILSQIKSHFQLQDLASSPHYPNWLVTLTQFTHDVYYAWRSISARTVFYLSSLWSSLVLPIPYLRLREVHTGGDSGSGIGVSSSNAGGGSMKQQRAETGLNEAIPKVIEAYIRSRCDMCAAAALSEVGGNQAADTPSGQNGYAGFGEGYGGIEDNPLDDEGMLLEELASFPVLVRFNFPASAALIASIYNDVFAKRQAAFAALLDQSGAQNLQVVQQQLTDAQARLAFLTYFIGAIVGGNISRVAANCVENLDELNADLASLVFRMVVATQQAEDAMTNQGKLPTHVVFGMGTDAGLKLELASLYFFRCFQNLYIESRAKEDLEVVENRRQRAMGMVEDPSGYLTFTWSRRSGGGTARPSPPSSVLDGISSSAGIIVGMPNTRGGAGPGSHGRRNSMEMMPITRTMALPSALPSLKTLGITQTAEQAPSEPSQDTDMDAADASKAAKKKEEETQLTNSITQRASALQQGIAGRLGIAGGDRMLLDIAMQRIFGLLRHARIAGGQAAADNAGGGDTSHSFAATANLIERALGVLYQLSIGITIVHTGARYSPRLMYSGRLLLESEVVQDLLKNPSAERFPLLLDPRHGRARTFLMATLSKLLYTQTRFPQAVGSEVDARAALHARRPTANANSAETTFAIFNNFMESLANVANRLVQVVTGGLTPSAILANINQIPAIDPSTLRCNEYAVQLIGLCRDLRGICFSATTPKDYELILSWICPGRMPILVAGAAAWYDNVDVAGPLLKLVAELIHSRRNRIVIPQNSAGGLILAREVCRVLLAYITPHIKDRDEERRKARENGTSGDVMIKSEDSMSMSALREAILGMGNGDGAEGRKSGGVISLAEGSVGPGITVDFTPAKIKCAKSCVLILTRMLNARLVNVGIMELYGDTSLVDSTKAIMELVFMGSPTHIMSFTKMSRALIVMLNRLAEQDVLLLVDVASDLFARMMACLGEALNSPDTAFSTPAARVVEAIAIFRCQAAAHASSSQSQMLLESNNIIFSGNKVRPSAKDMQRAAQAFYNHENAQPQLFGEFLSVCLDRLLTTAPGQEPPNTWSIARPVLPLALCSPHDFEEYRINFLNSQSQKQQEGVQRELDQIFSKLSPAIQRGADGIESNPASFSEVLLTNDLFTKELCTFARQLRNEL